MTNTKRLASVLGLCGVAATSAGLTRLALGAPQTPQQQLYVQSDVQLLQNRVTELEKKLAALQQQYASHTHNYLPTRCNAFLNLPTFKEVLNNPNREPGMGVCLVQPGGGMVATGQPNH